MATTLELPPDLLERARILAAERGTTIEELLGSILRKELGTVRRKRQRNRTLEFPIFPSSRPGSLDLTNADLARAEAEEDLRRHGLSR